MGGRNTRHAHVDVQGHTQNSYMHKLTLSEFKILYKDSRSFLVFVKLYLCRCWTILEIYYRCTVNDKKAIHECIYKIFLKVNPP